MNRKLVVRPIPSLRWKYIAASGTVFLAATLYLLPNRLLLAQATPLPLTTFDRAIPFWPWTGWIYVGIYIYLLWAFVSMRNLDHATRFLYACIFAQVTAALVFVAYPTIYPRDMFPVPSGTGQLNHALVTYWRRIDAPINCFPSLHVSTSMLCTSAFHLDRRRYLPLGIALALALSLSTMTFKQHYFIDVVAGLMLGLISYFIFFRWRRFTLTPPVRA